MKLREIRAQLDMDEIIRECERRRKLEKHREALKEKGIDTDVLYCKDEQNYKCERCQECPQYKVTCSEEDITKIFNYEPKNQEVENNGNTRT